MKNLKLILIAALGLLGVSCGNKSAENVPAADCNNDIILHAWSWSFNTIKENLKEIADAGYTIVQTSPANTCIEGENAGMQLFGEGKWYYHYQPTDWKIGNYQLGTRDEFIALCAEAKKYGIKIIVDVLPNHTAIDRSKVKADLLNAVGGMDNLYHANGLTPITDYNDRMQCTTGEMGGLPDVNTENPDFQHYYMLYVNDLLACGARGFRYDTATHIGLPSDPLDPKAKENDFWDIATGRKEVKGVKLALPMDSLFVYGEVLQDKNTKETEYAEYMGLTASNFGGKRRKVLNSRSTAGEDLLDWSHPVEAKKLITWVESHDTYCNAHESASIDDNVIALGWVFLTARQFGTPLFYSRPDGRTPENYWGNNLIGARGNDSFKSPVVVEANKFRHAMAGTTENVQVSADSTIVSVERGGKGIAIINLAENEAEAGIATTLPDGTYTDKVSGSEFSVNKGTLAGKLAPLSAVIIY